MPDQSNEVNPVPVQAPVSSPTIPQVRYAGFWLRFCALVVDGIIAWVITFVVAFMIGSLLHIRLSDDILIWVSVVISMLYYIILTYRYEATIGKMAMGIKVVSTKSEKLSIGQVIGRELAKIISTLILMIGYIMAAFTKNKQALHDMIASTAVVKVEGKKAKKWVIVLVVIIYVLISLIVTLAILNSARLKNDPTYRPASSDVSCGLFKTGNIYENTCYKFKFTYPEGAIFSPNRHGNFVVRFFFPNGLTIVGDEENIGIYVKENEPLNLEENLKDLEASNSKYGPIDVREVQFGGQKGYRLILTTAYTSSKGTREVYYFTVKDSTYYKLNYFPVVDENIEMVDNIAKSFEFTN